MAKRKSKSRKIVDRAFREVHANEPSTVRRAKRFGSGGKKAMLTAIALEKARNKGATIRKKRSKSKR